MKLTAFKCDGCNEVTYVTGNGLPNGWAMVTINVAANNLDVYSKDGHYCFSCLSKAVPTKALGERLDEWVAHRTSEALKRGAP